MSRDPSKSAHIDPVDDDTMEPTSVPTTQDQEASAFVKAISMIIGNDLVPNPNFGNQILSMVLTAENSVLLSYSAN